MYVLRVMLRVCVYDCEVVVEVVRALVTNIKHVLKKGMNEEKILESYHKVCLVVDEMINRVRREVNVERE